MDFAGDGVKQPAMSAAQITSPATARIRVDTIVGMFPVHYIIILLSYN
jgi:hypothetical protein